MSFRKAAEAVSDMTGLSISNGTACDVIGLRMKNRKISWSIDGATHMAKILACSKNGDLSKMIGCMMSGKVPEVMTGEVQSTNQR